jgi:hypothetical protein
MVVKWRDWDFDNVRSRGFEWLFVRDGPRWAESGNANEERLVGSEISIQEPSIPMPDLTWAGGPMSLDVKMGEANCSSCVF